jgi:hypothetical protein
MKSLSPLPEYMLIGGIVALTAGVGVDVGQSKGVPAGIAAAGGILSIIAIMWLFVRSLYDNS